MWLNVISINLMQLSKRMLFTEWKNVWFTRYQLCTGDKVRHTGRPSTIQSVRVCQTRMATTCGGSSPTTLFQPPIWVIGRARLSSVGAPSNQPYRLDWLEELHTGHPGIVRIVHCLGTEFTLITLRTKMGITYFSLTHILAGLRSTSCGKTRQQWQL